MKNSSLFVLLGLLAVVLLSCCTGDNPKIAEATTTSTTAAIIPTTVSTTTTTSLATTTSTTTTTQAILQTTTSSTIQTTTTTLKMETGPVVEVVFFDPNYVCASCIRVGAMLEKTLYSDYSKELASGKLVYKRLNLGNPKARDEIVKYGAVSPSMWIGTTVNGTFYKETKLGVWYKAQDEEGFREYVGGYLDKRLRGDLSEL